MAKSTMVEKVHSVASQLRQCEAELRILIRKTRLLDLLYIICDTLNLSPDDVMSPSRKRQLSDARLIYVYQASKMGYTPIEIVEVINRDRSIVSTSLKNYETYFVVDANFAENATLINETSLPRYPKPKKRKSK